jgi:hypothetical protein
VEIVLALALLSQATLTFSRGGLVNVIVAIIGCALALVRHTRSAARMFGILGFSVAVAAFVVLPRLDNFTDGALSQRFASADTTSRSALAANDVDIFWGNPVTGVGLGVAASRRGAAGASVAAHTEFTRMLAEQGVLGLVAILLLIRMVATSVVRASPGIFRALTVAMALWALTEMTHSAMRIGAIPFLVGLAVAAGNLVDEPLQPVGNLRAASGGAASM